MAKVIRYTLATICLAMSVSSLVLWYRSLSTWDVGHGRSFVLPGRMLNLQSYCGIATVGLVPEVIVKQAPQTFSPTWAFTNHDGVDFLRENYQPLWDECGSFGTLGEKFYFPLWFPALAFALAGVAVLKTAHFTLRSALFGTGLFTLLLGMIVVL